MMHLATLQALRHTAKTNYDYHSGQVQTPLAQFQKNHWLNITLWLDREIEKVNDGLE